MTTLILYSDFVCPYCLLAEKVLSDVVAGHELRVDRRAFELRPEPVPTLRPEDSYLPAVWQSSVYPLAARLGVSLRLPSVSPQPRTTRASELLLLAQERGLGEAYATRVLRAFFQEDLDIGDAGVLAQLAAEAGLNPHEARTALTQGTYVARHQSAQLHARNVLGIHSVPTLLVGKQVIRGVPAAHDLASALRIH